jgi:hypothetical protein
MQPDFENDYDAAQKESHFQNYSDYSKTLRAWLVAYGVGGPVLFLTNDGISKKVASSGHANAIVSAFLIGVALQIILALINKWAAWFMYRGAGDPDYQRGRLYSSWSKINSCSWIDFWVDLASLMAFMAATWFVLNVFLAPPKAILLSFLVAYL